jgi:hypothetical protein
MPTEQEVRQVISEYVTRVRQDLDEHIEKLTTELVRLVIDQEDQHRLQIQSVEAQVTQLQAAEVEAAQARAAQLEEARAEAAQQQAAQTPSVRDIRLETLERLRGSVRRIDESTTLNGILGALAQAAAVETTRVAILLVDGYMFRTWGHFGFAEGEGPTEMPVGSSGTLAAAVALQQTSFVPPLIEGQTPPGPSFSHVPAGHTGFVVPRIVGGEVVAVLYADDRGRSLEQEDAPLWTEEVELLARHAALRLENLTSARTVEVLARPD